MKISIIGAAQIVSKYHAHALNAHKEVDIQSIIDINKDRANVIAKKYNTYGSNDLNDAAGADIVFIAAPPSARQGILTDLPSSIKKIVIEKPASMNLEEYNFLNAYSVSKNIPIYIAQTRRYFLNHALINNLIALGSPGNIEKIYIREGSILNWVSNSNHHMQTTGNSDKGILQDVGSHLIDFLFTVLKILNFSFEDFSDIEVTYDYKNLSNDIHIIAKGPFDIDMHISRVNLLANKIKIYGSLGTISTRSLLDDKVHLLLQNNTSSTIRTPFLKSDYSLESAFVAMWKDLIQNDKKIKIAPEIKDMKQSIDFMQRVIDLINL